jgi:hypothetical protein
VIDPHSPTQRTNARVKVVSCEVKSEVNSSRQRSADGRCPGRRPLRHHSPALPARSDGTHREGEADEGRSKTGKQERILAGDSPDKVRDTAANERGKLTAEPGKGPAGQYCKTVPPRGAGVLSLPGFQKENAPINVRLPFPRLPAGLWRPCFAHPA